MSKLPFRMNVTNPTEQYRYDTFWDKEPETIEWIKSFEDNSIFFDIGANIGIYSLYCAAIHPGSTIYAFEPSVNNFINLMDNVVLSGYKNITYLFRAIGADYWHEDQFYEPSDNQPGSSGGQVGIKPKDSTQNYSIAVTTVDSMAEIVGVPNYVKIDIDGQEFDVVRGMKKTLKNEALKSVLIEIDQTDGEIAKEIILKFIDSGFTVDNRFNDFKPHSTERREKEGINVRNWVFTRVQNG